MIINPDKLVHLRIILKSGAEFTVKTKDFTVKWDSETLLHHLSVTGCVENFPAYLNLSEVAAIVRVFSNEGKFNE